MRRAPLVQLTEQQRRTLEQWARGRRISMRQTQRARVVLLAASGLENQEIARRLSMSRTTVGLWRKRFVEGGLSGIERDAPRGGRPPQDRRALVQEIIRRTTQEKPTHATHWTTRSLARELGTNQSLVHRVWRANGLKPHLTRTFKLSNDPHFTEKLLDVVGLYLNPPDHALVLCADEKSQIQALDRTQPGLPMKKGRAGTMTHDYKRHGTTTLFAALNILDGTVIARCDERHRHQEWLRFLKEIDRATPQHLDLHLIVDNYATHKHPRVKAWLAKHPRFHLHFIPTSSSWLNLVEPFFSQLTNKRIRRGAFLSVPDLIEAIHSYIDEHNSDPKPFTWTASAEAILEKVGRARVALHKSTTA